MRFSIFALVAGLLVCSPVNAVWRVSNRVVIKHGVLSIDHSKNVKEITAAQAKGGFAADLGVGLFQSRIKTELAFEEVSPPNKRLSLSTVISTSPVIYVAKELPKDSCAYKLVLGHELQHQEYDLEVLRILPSEINFITQDVFSPDVLERSGGVDQVRGRNHFFQRFNYVYQSLGELRHPVIDSPESYQRLGEMCNGELGKLLGPKPGPEVLRKKAN